MKATSELTTKVSADGYNKTQLNVACDMDRHVFHRDRLAHYFRWAHVMRFFKSGMSVVDLGCGDGALATMLYANRFKPEVYVGVDIRAATMERIAGYFEDKDFPACFMAADLCKDGWAIPVAIKMPKINSVPQDPDLVACFEFVEHVPQDQVEPFLKRVKFLMGDHTVFYLSTPCYDQVRKAENHVYEWGYHELKELLEKYFILEDHWGTFISQKDLEPLLESNEQLKDTWLRLKQYYGSEAMAILFAPLFPEAARNCIWKLRKPKIEMDPTRVGYVREVRP